MEIHPLQLVTITEPSLAGAGEAAEGDVFARMMAQLGLVPDGEAAITPAGVPTVDQGKPIEPGAPPVPDQPVIEISASALAAGPEPLEPLREVEEMLTPTDLLPLLAALVAPVEPGGPGGTAEVAATPNLPAAKAAPAALAADLGADTPAKAPAATDLTAANPAEPIRGATLAALHPLLARSARPTSAAPEAKSPGATRIVAPAPTAPLSTAGDSSIGSPAQVVPVVAPALPPVEAAPQSTAADMAAVAEPVIEHQLDLAREGEWLDQLARDIARTSSGDGTLRFRLNPEHLGSLHVELTQGSAGASVRLTADTEAARTILVDAQPRLIAEARSQGVKIAETHVDLGGQSQSFAGGHREGRDPPSREYLTTWKGYSGEESPQTPRRSSSERYA